MLVIVVTMTSLKVSSTVTVENEDGIGIEYYIYDTGEAYMYDITSLPSSIAEDDYFTLNIPESIIVDGKTFAVTRIDLNQKNVSPLVSRISKLYIPKSIKEIRGYFQTNLQSVIFENISGIEYSGLGFSYCRLENVIVKHISYDYRNQFGRSLSSQNIFRENTYKHAILYVPVGTWSDFAYAENKIPGWSNFIHIREMTMETEGLSEAKAYTMLDTKTFSYLVYDVINNSITSRGGHSNLDESSPNNSWQIIKNGNSVSLYNIGAKRFIAISSNGEMSLSTVPIVLPMTNTSNGIVIGNTQYGFVLNENVSIDQNVTSIEQQPFETAIINHYYNLNGQETSQPHKGINIMKMSNGKTKKVLVK